MPTNIAIRFEGLTKRFSRTTALDNVSFAVPQGSIFALLGPNGAGKTTLFSIAAGYLRADSGNIDILGIPSTHSSKLHGKFGILPQDAVLEAGAKVIDQLVLFGQLGGMSRADAVLEAHRVLEIADLPDAANKLPTELSHGMNKRIALCQAFIGSPDTIFLDEPTAGLDPENARKIRNTVASFSGEKTIIFSSHNLVEVQELCDHICILHRGRVIEVGTMADLTSDGQKVCIEFYQPPKPENIDILCQLSSVSKASHEKGLFWLVELNTSMDRATAMNEILSLLVEKNETPATISNSQSLEKRFLEVTADAEKNTPNADSVSSK